MISHGFEAEDSGFGGGKLFDRVPGEIADHRQRQRGANLLPNVAHAIGGFLRALPQLVQVALGGHCGRAGLDQAVAQRGAAVGDLLSPVARQRLDVICKALDILDTIDNRIDLQRQFKIISHRSLP